MKSSRLSLILTCAVATFALAVFATSIAAGELFFKRHTASEQAGKSVRVLSKKSHSFHTFTQGLEYYNGHFFESSGGYGKSFVIKYDTNHQELARFVFPYSMFAEGLTVFDDEVIVLSWKSGVVHFLDTSDLSLKRKKRIIGEGWGLANDGLHLYVSDGSNQLRIYNPKNMVLQDTVSVTLDGKKIANLNELEICYGKLYANIWGESNIVVLDLEMMKVLSTIQMSEIQQAFSTVKRRNPDAVMNGIACGPRENQLWVTGKLWNTRLLVEIQ